MGFIVLKGVKVIVRGDFLGVKCEFTGLGEFLSEINCI